MTLPIIGYIVFCSLKGLCYGYAVEGVYNTIKQCKESIVIKETYYRNNDSKKNTLYFGECNSKDYYKTRELGIII